ncbi:DUF2357 domain-containing protein [Acinetobacter haemolyticus]|uniref:DUF2357 domain-containing protein n=1 Tax=Acinetobacter haemolyticus TaxID=29430 RepID=UPI0013733567|nr:DUF2357 domain-containing protein [Acinetobacter haemolyticus]NAR89170.1 DUF2357 domain-containing protein [Acinetobacter haemolyticus]
MKVVIKVTGGRNAGKEYDLTQPPMDDTHYVLCEDDVLLFIVQTIKDRPSIHLALHEIFIPPTSVYPPTDTKPYFEYRWEPKRIGYNDYRSESFFHNFCGIAELFIVDKYQTSYDSFELENLQQLQPIEVFARKINADRISAMLDFLARNDGRDLAALARITRKYSGFKEGNKTLTFTLDRIEQYLNFLEDALPKIVCKPIVKLVQVNTIRPYSKFSNITEDSINHIISSPEHIYEVLDEEDSLFSVEDRYFVVDKILETEIVEETNLYENQVLHGFLELLIKTTDELLHRLGEFKVKKTDTVIQGYESLFNKLNQFSARLNQPCIERCNDFNRRLRILKGMVQTRLKVKQLYTSEPYFTHKSKQNLNYQKIFLMMIEWMHFGSPDWSLQNELNSIQDLSKLFEFYLFCVTKEHALNCFLQFNGGLIASPIDGSNDDRFVFQVNDEIQAELLYEPNIFHADAEDAVLPLYRNTEAWKRGQDNRCMVSKGKHSSVEARKDGFKLRVDHRNTQKSRRFRRSPDVVLRMKNEFNESLLIIDAKYMTSQKAFYEAMPECVMKYLHGIHIAATGQNTSIGLMIVNPDEEDITRHFHHDEYSIFSSKPVTPAIMTASIDVAKAHKLDSTIQRNIFRLLELMALQITKNGLGEIKINPVDLYKVEDNQSQLELKLIKVEESEARPLDHSEVEMTKNRPINHEAKQIKEKSRVKVSTTKHKKAPIRSKGNVDLPIGPLFNFKQSDYQQKELESNVSKNFEKLRQPYRP